MTNLSLQSAELKVETEGLMTVAQDKRLPTRNYQATIIKN